jgi:hypothetical protein
MHKNEPDPSEDETLRKNPELQDVEPGSDADAAPLPDVGRTPTNPNNLDCPNTRQ